MRKDILPEKEYESCFGEQYGHPAFGVIEMSHAQFVDFVSSPGRGSGIPVTLRTVRKGAVEHPLLKMPLMFPFERSESAALEG